VPIAAGSGYGLGSAGGVATYALDISQMPYHNHDGWTDAQGEHNHGTSMDSQGSHLHNLPNLGSVQAGGDNGGANSPVSTGYSSGRYQAPTDYQGTHYHTISVATAGNHGHNVGVGFRGSSAAIENRMPYFAMYFIQKMF
jgi:microcystin-dependent protein